MTAGDFNVSAKLDGQDYTLQDLDYDANDQRFTFNPVPLEGNIGKTLQVTITPASDKVTGSAQAIPNDTSNENARYWFVFDMNVSDNGQTINVTGINELRKSPIFKFK
ncbi:hypothetical protein [Clostridium sp.]|uniref:hypothetical protein n=1 Tax=Clostridium sp. TaxID=1506 RepID=UPI0026306BDD|nr:hypothetical protein [Clostridium sp.]